MSFELVFAFACLLAFYGAGTAELKMGGRDHGLLWASLSALISAIVLWLLYASFVWLVLAQLSLFFGIGIFRAMREK